MEASARWRIVKLVLIGEGLAGLVAGIALLALGVGGAVVGIAVAAYGLSSLLAARTLDWVVARIAARAALETATAPDPAAAGESATGAESPAPLEADPVMTGAAEADPADADPLEQLARLGERRAAGEISEDDYQAARKRIEGEL